MLIRSLAAVFCLLATDAAFGQVPALPDAGRAEAEEIARDLDADGDGVVTREELSGMAGRVFASIDADGDGQLVLAEMRDWQLGMGDLAEFRERRQAYDTAIAMVFDLFDRDNDGQVDPEEHEDAVMISAELADMDGDGEMSVDEYLEGFIFNVAMRNAVNDVGG